MSLRGLIYRGKSYESLRQLWREVKPPMSYATLVQRVRALRWSLRQAIETPVTRGKRPRVIDYHDGGK